MSVRTISNAGGNWNDVAAWAEGAVPVAGDDVRASASSGNLNINVPTAILNSFDLTNYVGTLAWTAGWCPLYVAGDFILSESMTLTYSSSALVWLSGTGVIKTYTHKLDSLLLDPGGHYSLQTDLILGYILYLEDTTWFDANDFDVTIDGEGPSGLSVYGATLYMGNGTWTISTNLDFYNTSIVYAEDSTIHKIIHETILYHYWDLRNVTLNNVIIDAMPGGVYGQYDIFINVWGTPTINSLTMYGPGIIYFDAGTVLSIGALTANGSAGNLVALCGWLDDPSCVYEISKASGQISVDYMHLVASHAIGGATWYAGDNSTDGGNNSGWVFTAPPPNETARRAQKGLISGYHCFMKQYIDFTNQGLAPLKLPDGTLW